MKPENDASPGTQRSGTQALERAMLILREIANRGYIGWQLTELAQRCGLKKSTAHRLLTYLVEARMLTHSREDNLYLPGPMLFELGLSVLPERGELQFAARNRLSSLARETSAVALLFFRSGDDAVCAVRVGTARLEAKALAIVPGTRKPLIATAGGIAILMALPKYESNLIVERNIDGLMGYSQNEIEGMRRMADRSMAEGFASNQGDVLPGVNAYAIPLFDKDKAAFASIALAGSARRLPASDSGTYLSKLRVIAEELESYL